MSKKILSISGTDWMKGLSIHPTLAQGGIFRQATNFYPFEAMGTLQPCLVPVAATDAGGIIDKTMKYIVSFNDGVPKVWVYAGDSAAELYEVPTSSSPAPSVTDRSSYITATGPAYGATSFQNQFVYAYTGNIKVVTFGGASNTSILASGINAVEHQFAIGPDQNLYFSNGKDVGKITSLTGTAGNSATVAFTLEASMTIRDIKSDGQYLIIIADDRSASSNGIGAVNCMVGYWDYASDRLTQRHNFKDAGMNALEILDDGVYVFGQDGLYATNIATKPKMILPFRGNSNITIKPSRSSQITIRDNAILWSSSASSLIYGYGSLVAGQKKIFFSPATATTGNITALLWNGAALISVTDTFKVYNHNIGSTRDSSICMLSNITLDKMYELDYIRVVTTGALATTQSVLVQSLCKNGDAVMSNEQTFSFANDGAKSTKIMPRYQPTVTSFNDIAQLRITTNKAEVSVVELYGHESTSQDQSS